VDSGRVSRIAPIRAQYKVALFRYYGMAIAVGALLVFFNLCAAYYGLAESETAPPAVVLTGRHRLRRKSI
jgi:hypothetical protein